MPSVLSQTARDDARTRFHVFTGLVIGLVVFLGGRLVQMQIIDKEQYQTEAAGNAIETLTQSKVVAQAMTDKCDMGNKGEGKK